MTTSTLTSKNQGSVTELKRILHKPKKKISIEQMNKVIAKRGSKL